MDVYEGFTRFFLPSVAGLFAGTIGSLVAPWVRWGIEKKKIRLIARREFISSVRKELRDMPDKKSFRENSVYSQIRPYLSDKTRTEIESDSIDIQLGGRGSGANNFAYRVYDDLAALENRWNLL